MRRLPAIHPTTIGSSRGERFFGGLASASGVTARGRVHADLAEAANLVGRGDFANLSERFFEERGLLVQSSREAERLTRCPDRVREDLRVVGQSRDGNGLLKLPSRLGDVLLDRDGRG